MSHPDLQEFTFAEEVAYPREQWEADGYKIIDAIDGFGEPILLAVPRPDKTGGSVAVQVKSGNPFRDPGSGTFGNGPAGAKVTKGGDALKGLSQPAQLYVTQIRNKTGATQIEVDVKDGRAIIRMLDKTGKVVANLNLPIAGQPQPGGATSPPPAAAKNGAQSRDGVVDEARSEADMGKLSAPAREQRINDLVDYMFARYNASGAIFSKPGTVHVTAPAGWDKKTINGLTDQELKLVSQRLAVRGWSQQGLKKLLLPSIDAERRNKIVNKDTNA